ncbi:hypothetical protein NCCP2716_17530 [Sporosarcina sp. NCCP-2716]|uniref:putative bifunctional diguanylate cyclase/phosphodiesterase n=1 Tax=Sporosarcina sp. NCCP-2716 TaxID=2943679 RepID=UPI00203F5E88|nr:EAL domain-containing protein [Sporosarcina sp. NCCP-2716]GKV69255.1 hypothetical protein NCCP2716_17530 [Sporosarcina sp. NCCP-2716]
MDLTTQRTKYGRLLAAVIGIITLSIIFEELLISITGIGAGGKFVEAALSAVILIVFSTPAMLYVYKTSRRTELHLQRQLDMNETIQRQLALSNIELEYNAAHDYLTGLPNRFKLFRVLDKKAAERTELSILFLDLDRFKTINDTMGHLSGDRFIKLVSIRLRQSLPLGTEVFRHGGDEFVILSELPNDRAAEVAGNVLAAFREPFIVNDTKLYTSASIGISHLPEHGADAASLIKNADKAMYRAKEQGGNTFQVFCRASIDIDEKQMRIESDLRKALEKDQLTLHYQPVIDLKTNKLEGCEALIRWEHPELGLVSPADFIPVAERSSLINDIGTWVLETACRQMHEWHRKDLSLRLAVNVSIRQFRNPDFPAVVREVLEITQFPAKRLILEITESMMQDDVESRRTIQDIRSLGVKIAIDDFGTGYSSLSKLGFLPIDYLKIDRSFTSEMLTHPPMQSIVQTIIDMGRNLNIALIAEGIEEEQQSVLLKEGGCQFGQGYLYSKPQEPETIERAYGLSPAIGNYPTASDVTEKAAAVTLP